MCNFIITTDATADLPLSYLSENKVTCISMLYNMDGEDHSFGNGEDNQTIEQFYQLMQEGHFPKTAQITPQSATLVWEPMLQSGTDILHIAFSSALSGSYNNCALAAKELSEKYPDRKVIVIDSLCASLGEGLYVDYAVQCRNNGKTLAETAEYLESHKQNLCHYFTVDDLHHLNRGGRVSKLTAIVGTLLKIKPLLHVDEQGRLINIGKTKGRRKSLEWLVERMAAKFDGNADQRVFISHGCCPDDAELVAQLVKEKFGITDVMVNAIGPVVGTHSGPGTVALFFMGSGRKEK